VRCFSTNEGPERLHRDVDAGIHNPQHACGEPEVWRIGHDEERQRSEYRAHQEIWTAAAQAIPGPVTHVTNNWLHDQSGQWRRHPQDRDIVDGGAERLEDAADVRVLQREPHLDPEKAETHVPDLPK
jgi:hypothetical protein